MDTTVDFTAPTSGMSTYFHDNFTSSAYDNTTPWYDANVTRGEYDDLLEYFGGLYIHPHYYKYLEGIVNLPDIYFYLLGIYIGIVGFIGTFGNALVIYIFSTTKNLQTPPNLFIISLAISDLGFSAINGFPLMTISSFMRRWYFGEAACTLYAMLGGVFGFNSIGTLAFISLDRYYVIAFPFDAMRKCTKKRAMIQIAFVWCWAIALCIPPLFGMGQYQAEGVMVECSFDYISSDTPSIVFIYIMLFVGFLTPVLIIIICYLLIIRAVSNQAAKMRKKAGELTGESKKTEKEKQQNIQLAKIAATTISLFVISWVPYAVFAFAGQIGFPDWVTPTTTQIPVLFAKASAMWNPILYALSHPRFRAVLEAKFPFLLFCQGSNVDKGGDDDKSDTQTSGSNKLGREDSQTSVISEISENDNRGVSSTPSGRRGNADKSRNVRRPEIASGPAPARYNVQAEVNQEYETQQNGNVQAGIRRNIANLPVGADVNPRAMTRAANAIFSHLVTAYEGMRVLTSSGDGQGANKVDQSFVNPAFEANNEQHMAHHPAAPAQYPFPVGAMPMNFMMGHHNMAATHHQNGTTNGIYAVPIPNYGMGMQSSPNGPGYAVTNEGIGMQYVYMAHPGVYPTNMPIPNTNVNQNTSTAAPNTNRNQNTSAAVPNINVNQNTSAAVPNINVNQNTSAAAPNTNGNQSTSAAVPNINVNQNTSAAVPNTNENQNTIEAVPNTNMNENISTAVPSANENQNTSAALPNNNEKETTSAAAASSADIGKTPSESVAVNGHQHDQQPPSHTPTTENQQETCTSHNSTISTYTTCTIENRIDIDVKQESTNNNILTALSDNGEATSIIEDIKNLPLPPEELLSDCDNLTQTPNSEDPDIIANDETTLHPVEQCGENMNTESTSTTPIENSKDAKNENDSFNGQITNVCTAKVDSNDVSLKIETTDSTANHTTTGVSFAEHVINIPDDPKKEMERKVECTELQAVSRRILNRKASVEFEDGFV